MADLQDFYRRYLACCNERRFGDMGAFVHDEIRFNGEPTSLADYAAAIASNIDAVSDYHWTIEDIATTEDLIAVRLTDTGTPTKEWLGINPRGRSMTIAEFAFYRVRDGKIAEMWFLLDAPSAKRQLEPQYTDIARLSANTSDRPKTPQGIPGCALIGMIGHGVHRRAFARPDAAAAGVG